MLAGAADAAASGSGPPGARRLGELLAPVAEAVRKRLHDEQYNQKRPRDHDDEWEEEYLLCEFEEEAPSLEGEIRVQALDTATPRVTVNGNTYCGRYSNTVGSVIVFDSDQLQAVLDGKEREGTAPHRNVAPLCVTTKRMRLEASH